MFRVGVELCVRCVSKCGGTGWNRLWLWLVEPVSVSLLPLGRVGLCCAGDGLNESSELSGSALDEDEEQLAEKFGANVVSSEVRKKRAVVGFFVGVPVAVQVGDAVHLIRHLPHHRSFERRRFPRCFRCRASGSSTVAIDNKIEQAMDLVKSHLMFAVREEVDVLKEKITELMDRINQLEYENSILRAAASQETLAKLSQQPPPNIQPPNPSS